LNDLIVSTFFKGGNSQVAITASCARIGGVVSGGVVSDVVIILCNLLLSKRRISSGSETKFPGKLKPLVATLGCFVQR